MIPSAGSFPTSLDAGGPGSVKSSGYIKAKQL